MQNFLLIFYLLIYFLLLYFIILSVINYFLNKSFLKGIIILFPVIILVFISGNLLGILFSGGLNFAVKSSLSVIIFVSLIILLIKSIENLSKVYHFRNFVKKYKLKIKFLKAKSDLLSKLKLAEMYEKVNEYEKADKIYERLKNEVDDLNLVNLIERNRMRISSYIKASEQAEKDICDNCGNKIPVDRIFCPFCNSSFYPLNLYKFFKYKLKFKRIHFVFLALFIFSYLIFLGPFCFIAFLIELSALFSLIYDPFEGLSEFELMIKRFD